MIVQIIAIIGILIAISGIFALIRNNQHSENTLRLMLTNIGRKRYNLARLAGAQFVVTLALVIQLIVNPAINIVPLFGSLSIFSVILSVIRNEFFRVTDSGHEWVFEQMNNAYIIVDSLYGYLDSNNTANKLFPCINEYRQNECRLELEKLYSNME